MGGDRELVTKNTEQADRWEDRERVREEERERNEDREKKI